jgi:16S rRNA processing protein RimM
MFNADDFVRIGFVKKTFGYKGALMLDIKDQTTCDLIDVTEPVFLKLHGTLVPFFVSGIQGGGDNPVVSFDSIVSKEQAKTFINVECYLPAALFDNKEMSPDIHPGMLVGFVLKDEPSGMSGKITHFIDNPNNPLFEVRFTTGDVLLPCHEDMILNIDHKKKTITAAYPEGLIK